MPTSLSPLKIVMPKSLVVTYSRQYWKGIQVNPQPKMFNSIEELIESHLFVRRNILYTTTAT